MFKRSGFWLAVALTSMIICACVAILQFKRDVEGDWLTPQWATITLIVLGAISLISFSIHLFFEQRDKRKREFCRQIST